MTQHGSLSSRGNMIGLLLMLLMPILALTSPVDQMEPRDACIADNCLRAVRASAFPTRSGTADCSSYFMTTITPAPSTITSTISFSVTSVIISDITITSIIPISTTNFIDETTTTTVTTIRTVSPFPFKYRRQATLIPSLIPTYASACSGSVRYSSACSCIGVTGTTITASTPFTTTTVSVTVTPTTTTALTTVATEDSSSVAETVTASTTDVTATATWTSIVLLETGLPFTCGVGSYEVCCRNVVTDGANVTGATGCTVYYDSGSETCNNDFTGLCCTGVEDVNPQGMVNVAYCTSPVFSR